jgi:hypothetical protein
MKFKHWLVCGLAALLAGDYALSSLAAQQEGGTATGAVPLLSMLEIGPRVGSADLVGAGDCDCSDWHTTGTCTAESGKTCSSKYVECESPTSSETADITIKTGTTEDCTGSGCVTHDKREGSSECTEKPPSV